MESEKALQICRDLDQALLAYLSLLEKYQQQRKRTNFLINNGFMELTHAKYIMGSSKISQFQYDRRMQAATRVEWNSDALISFDSGPEANSSTVPLSGRWIMTTNAHEPTKETFLSSSDSIGPIRQRATHSSSSNSQTLDTITLDEGFKGHENKQFQDSIIPLTEFTSSTEATAAQTRRDPINWFGMLAPAQLKNSQASFQQAVLELTTSANLLIQLEAAESRVRELQAKKRELV